MAASKPIVGDKRGILPGFSRWERPTETSVLTRLRIYCRHYGACHRLAVLYPRSLGVLKCHIHLHSSSRLPIRPRAAALAMAALLYATLRRGTPTYLCIVRTITRFFLPARLLLGNLWGCPKKRDTVTSTVLILIASLPDHLVFIIV